MSLKNKSMYAILAILNLTSGTGYDIKKYSDKVLSGFWNENFGHIYPTLKKLLEEGMIEIVSGDAEDKKIMYGITAKGKKELTSWLSEDTALQPTRSEFMLKLFFSSGRPKEEIIHMLEENREYHEKNCEQYKKMLDKVKQGISELSDERERLYIAVLRKGILSSEASIAWCNETIAQYEN